MKGSTEELHSPNSPLHMDVYLKHSQMLKEPTESQWFLGLFVFETLILTRTKKMNRGVRKGVGRFCPRDWNFLRTTLLFPYKNLEDDLLSHLFASHLFFYLPLHYFNLLEDGDGKSRGRGIHQSVTEEKLFTHINTAHSIYIYLSVCPSIHPSVHPSVHISIHLSI